MEQTRALPTDVARSKPAAPRQPHRVRRDGRAAGGRAQARAHGTRPERGVKIGANVLNISEEAFM